MVTEVTSSCEQRALSNDRRAMSRPAVWVTHRFLLIAHSSQLLHRVLCRPAREPLDPLSDWWMRLEQVHQAHTEERLNNEKMRSGWVAWSGRRLSGVSAAQCWQGTWGVSG